MPSIAWPSELLGLPVSGAREVLLLAAALYRGVTLIETVAEFASGFTLITPESVLLSSTELGAELSSLRY